MVEEKRHRRWALIVEYDGSAFHGYERQRTARTVRGELEQALERLTGEAVRLSAASRTDAGAHAAGQVVSFAVRSALSADRIVSGLNHFLPAEVSIQAAHQVSAEFDARRSAVSRVYEYRILRSTVRSPLESRAWLVAAPLDLAAMSEAAGMLVGEHDFASFTGAGGSTVRRMLRAEVREEGRLAVFEAEANAFLPHQMRRIVGELVEVGRGKKTTEEFAELLRRPRRGGATRTAPACGLCLLRVNYREGDLVAGD